MPIRFNDREISAVVLDFDNTIYSADEELEAQIWGEVRRRLVKKVLEINGTKDISDHDFAQYLHNYVEQSKKIGWKPYFLEQGGSANDFLEIIASVSIADYLSFDEDLAKFINELMQYIPVYIFTGSNSQRVFEALNILIGDMWSQFEHRVLAADDMKRGLKPDQAAYQEMIERFGIDPKNTIFLDDQLVEVQTAASLGIITFLIQRGSIEKSVPGPHVILRSILELSTYLTCEK